MFGGRKEGNDYLTRAGGRHLHLPAAGDGRRHRRSRRFSFGPIEGGIDFLLFQMGTSPRTDRLNPEDGEEPEPPVHGSSTRRGGPPATRWEIVGLVRGACG